MIRYELETTTIGVGGFARVKKGIDNTLERRIAAKILDPVMRSATNIDKDRFHREAKILAKLSHPNIPAIYDVVLTDSEFQIIFQYIDGDNLQHLLTGEEHGLPITHVRSWFEQVASALEHAHETGVTHRDIKPANMVITKDRKHCYLVDFGLAFTHDDMVRLTGSALKSGTPGYMSQEQENGEKPSALDDIYSLGISLYEALCGRRVTTGGYEELSAQDETIPPAIDLLLPPARPMTRP